MRQVTEKRSREEGRLCSLKSLSEGLIEVTFKTAQAAQTTLIYGEREFREFIVNPVFKE